MLQQTQVATVVPYFERFMARFPDVGALASAATDDVLQLWAGLGYYARGRNLHKAAQIIVREHDGCIPDDSQRLQALPGIGRSTAAAILAQAYGQRHAILDGNVRRLLARHAAIEGWPGSAPVQNRLWEESERRLPITQLADYTQAIMDLGSNICRARQPLCEACPVAEDCAGRTDWLRYPTAKPKRQRSRRHAHLLLLEDARGALFLERRPPTGVWGGLWCPPVVDASEAWREALHARFRFECGAETPLAPLRHQFTHFELELRPLRLQLTASTGVTECSGQRWINMQMLEPLPGLPAPVVRLLRQLHPPAPDTVE